MVIGVAGAADEGVAGGGSELNAERPDGRLGRLGSAIDGWWCGVSLARTLSGGGTDGGGIEDCSKNSQMFLLKIAHALMSEMLELTCNGVLAGLAFGNGEKWSIVVTLMLVGVVF